jgi:hypothetical protein
MKVIASFLIPAYLALINENRKKDPKRSDTVVLCVWTTTEERMNGR